MHHLKTALMYVVLQGTFCSAPTRSDLSSERNESHAPTRRKAPLPRQPSVLFLQLSNLNLSATCTHVNVCLLVLFLHHRHARRRPVDAVATALVFFHKFYMLHSFHRHERLFVSSACLFLAAKVEVRLGCIDKMCARNQSCTHPPCTHPPWKYVSACARWR